MTDENADWEHDELTLEGYGAAPYPITLDTFAEDEVPVGLMAYQSEKQLNYAAANGVFANYCTFSETAIPPLDGTTCSGPALVRPAAVIFARRLPITGALPAARTALVVAERFSAPDAQLRSGRQNGRRDPCHSRGRKERSAGAGRSHILLCP